MPIVKIPDEISRSLGTYLRGQRELIVLVLNTLANSWRIITKTIATIATPTTRRCLILHQVSRRAGHLAHAAFFSG